MRILCLDLGKRTGFACGLTTDAIPELKAVRLRRDGQSLEVQCGNLGMWLRDLFVTDKPDEIVVEDYMNPAGSKSADATISQLLCHGALLAIAGCYGIPVRPVKAGDIRKHFIGRASCGDRQKTNDAMVKRAVLLGYLPSGSGDWDKASAAGLFDYARAHFYGRAAKFELYRAG